MDRTFFMQRCLDLASLGAGQTAQNPMVGCVIVHNDRIIGEGFHEASGQPHAEVNAIHSVAKTEMKLLPEADLYVNLEPCSHYGKTPPCTETIIKHGIKNIYVGSPDPNPLVNGSGIKALKAAGHKVVTKLLEEQCLDLNKYFFTFHSKKRPHIILKWAQSKDSFFTGKSAQQVWHTNELSQRIVHKWRSEVQAIMVGTNTAKTDDPMLTTRLWKGQNPARIIIDKDLNLNKKLNIFNNKAPTYIFNAIKTDQKDHLHLFKLNFKTALIPQIMGKLFELQMQSVLVEGGKILLQSFIQSGLWDEARILTGANYLQEGVSAPMIRGQLIDQVRLGNDQLKVFKNTSG